MRNGTANRIAFLLALTAMLFAATGLHLMHSSLHRAGRNTLGAGLEGDSRGGAPRVTALPTSGPCPVCKFLATFRTVDLSAPDPLAAPDLVAVGSAPADWISLPRILGLPIGARAPPL